MWQIQGACSPQVEQHGFSHPCRLSCTTACGTTETGRFAWQATDTVQEVARKHGHCPCMRPHEPATHRLAPCVVGPLIQHERRAPGTRCVDDYAEDWAGCLALEPAQLLVAVPVPLQRGPKRTPLRPELKAGAVVGGAGCFLVPGCCPKLTYRVVMALAVITDARARACSPVACR